MPIPFEIPVRFLNKALYLRVGALIKERATGRIVAHLQETSLWGVLRHVPVPGANVLNLITDSIQIGQLVKIQKTLDTIQTLATVGAIASVASLGVSVAGFGLVLARLGRMDRKLDKVLDQSARLRQLAQRINIKLDVLQLAKLRAELEAVGMAVRFETSRRNDSLRRSIAELSTLRHYYGALLADPEITAVGTEGVPALLDAHERLTAAAEAELFAELLLGGEPDLLQERWSRQEAVFNEVAWRDARGMYELLEEADKSNGVYLMTPPEDRTAKVKAFAEVRAESIDRLRSMPLLADAIAKKGIPADRYLKMVEERQRASEQPLLVFELDEAEVE